MPRGIRRVVVFVFLGVAPALAQLPPEILADQYLLQADQQIAKNDHEGALESLQKILALQQEHGLTLPQAFHFKYAQVAFAAGSFAAALDSVNRYLVTAGREGKFYQKALELLLAIKAAADRTPCAGQPKGAECWLELANQAGCYLWNPEFQPYKTVTWTAECTGSLAQGRGTLKWVWNTGDKLYQELKPAEKIETSSTSSDTLSAPQLRAGTPSTFRDEPTCSGQPKGTACWMELADQAGCYLWNPNLQVDATVTWTGECVEGLAQGTGTRKWVYDSGKKTSEGTGHLQAGRGHGDWVEILASGDVREGPYVDGKEHGQWVERGKHGSVKDKFYVEGEIVGSNAEAGVMEGLLVAGRGHGDWVEILASGDVREGPYVDGKRHGDWVWRGKHGSVQEGPYVQGKKYGPWVEILASGSVQEGPYVDGKRHGDWVWRGKHGSVQEGLFVQGKKHGPWVRRAEDGSVDWEGHYVEGKLHGPWFSLYKNGNYYQHGHYVEGKRQGYWSRRAEDGRTILEAGSYVEGERHGDWTIRDENGNVEEGPYVKGQRHGEWIFYPKGKKREHTKITYTDGRAEFLRPEMVEIPGGSFRMGCVSGKSCQGDEKPVHEVRIASFALSKYEVTFEEYDQFTAATGRERAADKGWGRGRRPVIRVSWKDAVAYTEWLSEAMGERYRLPSEAEWEYAARAGSVTKYSWGNKIGRNRANCEGCGSQWDERQTAPVGSFGPNGWGLHDMHGNVWEWVQDCWNKSYRGAPVDGSAWESGDCSQRVLRGGPWNSNPRGLRSANRSWSTTTYRIIAIGFRVARTVTP